MEFARFTTSTNLTSAEATKLMREKVKLGSVEEDAYEFLVLSVETPISNDANQPPALPRPGQRIRIETVEQYLAALKRGASPFTTFDMAMDGWFRSTAATLQFLVNAKESRRSSLPTRLLPQLPVSILGYHDSDQEREMQQAMAKGTTLLDYQRSGKLLKFEATATTLTFQSTIKSYHLTELARGDYNHDGSEDSLVQVSWHYVEGSGRGVELWLVEGHSVQPLQITPFPLP